MKTKRDLLFIALLLMSAVSVEAQEMVVAETQNSGCLANTRSGEESDYDYGKPPTIVLTKEGDILLWKCLTYGKAAASRTLKRRIIITTASMESPAFC